MLFHVISFISRLFSTNYNFIVVFYDCLLPYLFQEVAAAWTRWLEFFWETLKFGVGGNFMIRLFSVLYSSADAIIGEIRSNSVDSWGIYHE